MVRLNMELGQVSKKDSFKYAFMQSVGFIISEDVNQITLAREIVDENDCRGVITIPKVNIRTQLEVKLIEKD